MMRDAEIVADRLAHLRPELDRIGVKTLHLFGSRARGDARADSEWDFLVECSRPPGFDQFMDLKLLLENQLCSRVDLLSRTACGQRLLRAIEPELVHAA
jgi:predicted nucleotidyltransferase